MTEDELNEIEVRANAATPGPWKAGLYGSVTVNNGLKILNTNYSSYNSHGGNCPDAEFIACAREDVPALIAEVRRLKAENEGLMAGAATLKRLGYTYEGGIEWQPPLGKAPDWNLMDRLHERAERAEAERDVLANRIMDMLDTSCPDPGIKGEFECPKDFCDCGKQENKCWIEWAKWEAGKVKSS